MEHERLILNYATPEPPDRWAWYRRIPGPIKALTCAGICYGIGLWLGDDLGSGRVILNPFTYVLSVCFLFWMYVYMVLRIAGERHMPGFCKAVMCVACFIMLPAIYVMYYDWNRQRMIPPIWKLNGGFWGGLYWLGACIAVFAFARTIGWFYKQLRKRRARRKRAKRRGAVKLVVSPANT